MLLIIITTLHLYPLELASFLAMFIYEKYFQYLKEKFVHYEMYP